MPHVRDVTIAPSWTLARIAHLGLVLCAGCGADDAAVPPGPCWPLDAVPGGSVELGTGDIKFAPMPDTVTIERNGTQSDPYLPIHARIRGLPPGDPNDFFDPTNPKTKISASVDDIGLVLGIDCPASIGYVPSPEPDAYDMLHSLRIGFGTNALSQIDGKSARLVVEVVGSNGLYARDERIVVLMAPPPAP